MLSLCGPRHSLDDIGVAGACSLQDGPHVLEDLLRLALDVGARKLLGARHHADLQARYRGRGACPELTGIRISRRSDGGPHSPH